MIVLVEISFNQVIYKEPLEIIKRSLIGIPNICSEMIFLIHEGYPDLDSLNFLLDLPAKTTFKNLDNSVVEAWRNNMLKESSGEWILILDPDEYLDGEAYYTLKQLKRGILSCDNISCLVFSRKNFEVDEYGKIHYMRFYPDYQLRFFRRGKATYSGRVHDPPRIEGSCVRARGNIIHDKLWSSVEEIRRKVDLFKKSKEKGK